MTTVNGKIEMSIMNGSYSPSVMSLYSIVYTVIYKLQLQIVYDAEICLLYFLFSLF